VFAPYTSIPTNLLFFDRPGLDTPSPALAPGASVAKNASINSAHRAQGYSTSGATDEIWFYEHTLPEGVKNYTKTRPMQFEEFQPILDWWDAPQRIENERAWKVRAADVIQTNGGGDVASVNLDIKNPNRANDLVHLPPVELAESIAQKEKKILSIITEIQAILKQ